MNGSDGARAGDYGYPGGLGHGYHGQQQQQQQGVVEQQGHGNGYVEHASHHAGGYGVHLGYSGGPPSSVSMPYRQPQSQVSHAGVYEHGQLSPQYGQQQQQQQPVYPYSQQVSSAYTNDARQHSRQPYYPSDARQQGTVILHFARCCASDEH